MALHLPVACAHFVEGPVRRDHNGLAAGQPGWSPGRVRSKPKDVLTATVRIHDEELERAALGGRGRRRPEKCDRLAVRSPDRESIVAAVGEASKSGSDGAHDEDPRETPGERYSLAVRREGRLVRGSDSGGDLLETVAGCRDSEELRGLGAVLRRSGEDDPGRRRGGAVRAPGEQYRSKDDRCDPSPCPHAGHRLPRSCKEALNPPWKVHGDHVRSSRL